MKKMKKTLLFLIPTLLVIGIGIFVVIKYKDIQEEEKHEYCNDTNCYTYYKEVLKEYKIEGNNVILQDTCKKCKDKIIHHTKDKLVLKNGNNIYHYYKKGYDVKRKKFTTLAGKAYKSENNEIYFFNDEIIIIANKKGLQRKYTYTQETFDDEYLNINLFHKIAYTYNTDTEEILGYKKIEKDELEKIDLSYYEEDGTIKAKDTIRITGNFILKDKNNNVELYVYQNKILYSSFGDIVRGEFKTMDANEEELFLNYNNTEEIQFIYNIKEKQLYTADYEKYISVEKKQLEDIPLDFYNQDTSLKEITTSIDGAYQYIEENIEKEILIKDGTITIVEYYIRFPEKTKQEKYKYQAYTRNEETITYIYNTENKFKYSPKERTITIYFDEYKKVKESDLKHIQ